MLQFDPSRPPPTVHAAMLLLLLLQLGQLLNRNAPNK